MFKPFNKGLVKRSNNKNKQKHMKTKNLLSNLSIGLLIAGSIFTVSCRKATRELLNDSATNSEDEQTEMVEDNADQISDAALKGDNSGFRLGGADEFSKLVSSCAVITRDSLNHADQDTTTIDFGNGCTGPDGKVRKGKIIIYHTLKYFEAGSVRKTTFLNYYVNDNKLEGERTVTNKGKNSSNQSYWEVVASNMKLTRADGKFRTWSSSRIRTIISGEQTTERSDDVYRIEGSASGVNGKGDAFTATITNPLIKSTDCRWIKQGVIVFSVQDKADRTIDFGDGNCDDQAVVTVKNKTKTITLK